MSGDSNCHIHILKYASQHICVTKTIKNDKRKHTCNLYVHQALGTLLTKIQKLTSSELVMFTEMLRCAALAEGDASSGGGNNSGHIEVYLCLLQQCVARSMKMTKGSLHKRVELVQIFVELFLSPSIAEDYNDNDINRGNVDAVRKMLKPFLAEARIAKNPRIVCMNIMLHAHYVSVEARALISSIGDIENVKLPTWKEISLCPMYFLQVVRVLYCIASSTNDVIHWADRVDHCIQLLKELDSVFRLCTIDSLIDIVELRAAYYLGINNHAKAEKSLKQFRNYIIQSEKSNLLCSENTLAMNSLLPDAGSLLLYFEEDRDRFIDRHRRLHSSGVAMAAKRVTALGEEVEYVSVALSY